MKYVRYVVLFTLLSTTLLACTTDDSAPDSNVNPNPELNVDVLSEAEIVDVTLPPGTIGNSAEVEVTAAIVDDFLVVGSDIIVGVVTASGEYAFPQVPNELETQGNIMLGTWGLWPNGVIPYTIDQEGFDPEYINQEILPAISYVNNNTILTMVDREEMDETEDDTYFVRFTPYSSCMSWIGRVTGTVTDFITDEETDYANIGQPIALTERCRRGSVIHEIGHAVGLLHEHERHDRDEHIQLFRDNFSGSDDFWESAIFEKNREESIFGDYDFDSIMHYHSRAGAKGRNPVILPRDSSIDPARLGQREGFSSGDIAAIEQLYASEVGQEVAPDVVSFTAMPASIEQGQSSTLSWQVEGDATLSITPAIGEVTGTSISVTPPDTTTYTLTASNDVGSDSLSTTVTVTPAPTLTATLSAEPVTGEAPLTVAFDATASSDAQGITNYAFDFGDGNSQEGDVGSITHTYEAAGEYAASVTVTNQAGQTATATVTITVNEQVSEELTVTLNANPATGEAPLTVTFEAAINTDAENVTEYAYDFGDGNFGDGDSIDVETGSATHTYETAGEYTASVTVTNQAGQMATATVTITVTNRDTNTVYFLTPPDYDADPVLNDSIAIVSREAETVVLERLGSTQQPLTVQLRVPEASTIAADEIIVRGARFDATSNTLRVTFPEQRSRTSFDFTVPAAALDGRNEEDALFILELVEADAYEITETTRVRYSFETEFDTECVGDFIIDGRRDDTEQVIEAVTGCSVITGSLVVYSTSLENLSFLAGLTSIEGTLEIGGFERGNDNLTSLTGLEELTLVGGSILIEDNDILTSLKGLEGLTSIGRSLQIRFNDVLTSLDALSGITSVQNLTIEGDLTGDSPTSLSGLEGITGDLENLQIIGDSLTSLDALSGITGVRGVLTIAAGNSLTSLSGLEGITGDVEFLQISGDSLTSLAALSGITSVGGTLNIRGDSLTSLNGLEGITGDVESLGISGDSLTSLDALSGITSVRGFLNIIGDSLTSLNVLEGITGDLENLQIIGDSLTSLDALSGITSVRRSLRITGNSLTSLSGLQGITSIGEDLSISRNNALTSLNGTENITEVGGSIRINQNPSLDCTPFGNFPYMPVTESTGNLVNCPTQ